MAVKIRLKRLGKKKQPFYRIVVADSRAPRDGRSIEKLGHYNPITDPAELVINEERLFHWLDQGAQPSDTVFSLLRGQGITLKYELKRRNADEATISKEMQKWELARNERSKKKAVSESAKLAEAAKAEAAAETEEEAVTEEASAAPAEDVAAVEESETPVAKTGDEPIAEAAAEIAAEEVSEAPAEEVVAEPTENPEKEDS